MATKFCLDCKHSRSFWLDRLFGSDGFDVTCAVLAEGQNNPITGKMQIRGEYPCVWMRSQDPPIGCGDGKLWEAK